ncbi:hypothetical protein SDC9_144119 [bioreactor metagenome]|uniref:Tripartite ATP-independent periplasmic transporters DctQ component domain-containing protein n=1 Tax=bioreactor metagenome TaxID=1076179 RepID=A0A645E5Y3_9ZZZZ
MKKLDVITKVIEIICAMLMVIMVVTTFIQIIRRYVFGTVFPWAEEIAIYSMIWIAFMGAVLCLRHSDHTRIDFFISLLPHKIKKMVEIFDYFLCFAFMMLLSYHSFALLDTLGNFKSTGAQIPYLFVYSCILVSGLLMVPYFFVLIYQKLSEPNPAVKEKGIDN